MPDRPDWRARRQRLFQRLRVGQVVALAATGPLAIVLAAVVVGILTVSHQNAIRTQLLTRVEPANSAALKLTTAMLNQETAIRGYELTGEAVTLEPYHLGRTQEMAEIARLRAEGVAGATRDLDLAVQRIDAWERDTAEPALRAHVPLTAGSPVTIDATLSGKGEFDAIRAALSALQNDISARVRAVKSQLNQSARTTTIALGVIGIVLVLTVLGTGILLQRVVGRPLGRLTADARRVAAGDLSHSLALSGPLDVEQLAGDVDAMRRRLLEELETVNTQRGELILTAEDLERSNAELEQFAYVASHDLQEPLRKVTSFCQMLQERYGGQLDEQADQYIGFAVDGALRMQQLINDLLAFSRVGRRSEARVPTDLGELARAAAADLDPIIEETGAHVTIGPLPVLPVEGSLVRAVFQNLIGNAIKFHGDRAPEVEVTAEPDGREWRFSCTDNGIGIDAEYADRVFIIFQRLHSRERYPGTGIGLALCRKIIEHHGGRIWLDAEHHPGTRFIFTLPDDSDTMPA